MIVGIYYWHISIVDINQISNVTQEFPMIVITIAILLDSYYSES